ncbi:MAG: penicillin-binding protein 1A, partial [Alphaproteobacteria bacterium]
EEEELASLEEYNTEYDVTSSLEEDILFAAHTHGEYEQRRPVEGKSEQEDKKEKKKKQAKKKLEKSKKKKSGRRDPFSAIIAWLLGCISWFFAVSISGALLLIFACLPFYQRVKNDVVQEYQPVETLQSRHYTTTSRIYGDNGILSEIADENRFYLPLNKIPTQVKEAFIATEDSRFYKHFGADPKGIIKAVLETVLDGDSRGASTITQQMVKNEVLTPVDPITGQKLEAKTTIDRKLKEIVSAIEVEKYLTKDYILEQYLNGILLGRFQTYGVASASQYYFNKELSDLSLAQAAYLAATPKAPSTYDIWRNPEKGESRKKTVISRMLDEGYINKKEAEEARNEVLVPARAVRASKVQYAGYFAAAVRKNILDLSKQYGFPEDGLTVYTTLNTQLQEYAYHALRNGLINYDRSRGWRGAARNISLMDDNGRQINWIEQLDNTKLIGLGEWKKAIILSVDNATATLGFVDGSTGILDKEGIKWTRKAALNKVLNVGDVIAVTNLDQNRYELQQIPAISGAMVAMDPNTGKVLALQGGFGYDAQRGAYNRATDAQRQPGSSFKPFVYLTAMEQGYTPATNVYDRPIRYGDWEPKNYGGKFLGQMTMRKALCLSRNTPTVQVGEAIGMKNVADTVQRLGVITNEKELLAVSQQLSATLGSQEVTPLHMATGYSQIVNGGRKVVPTAIDRIQDLSGKVVYRHDNRECATCKQDQYDGGDMPYLPDNREQVADPISAYQITSILQCVVTSGTAPRVGRSLDFPVAGKTGTTNDEKDAWFVGFTPDLVVAVYVGYDQPRKLGRGMTGGHLAAPIFVEFMKKAMEGKGKTAFRVPEGATMMYVSSSGWPTYTKEGHLTAFKPGTEPVGGPKMLSGGTASSVDDYEGSSSTSRRSGAVTKSTGGLW